MLDKKTVMKFPAGRRPNLRTPTAFKATGEAELYPPSAAGHPRGSVLLYTFVILMLMTLMGAALMVNSRTELQISGSTAQGRDSFTKADATARVALLLARALLHPSAGNARDYLNNSKTGQAGQEPFEVTLDNSVQTYSDLQKLTGSVTVEQIKERYLRVTEADGQGAKAHLTLTYGGQVVGTAFMGLASSIPNEYDSNAYSSGGYASTGGGSIGDRTYDDVNNYVLKAYLVISSMGRLTNDDAAFTEEGHTGVYSVITSVFREIIP